MRYFAEEYVKYFIKFNIMRKILVEIFNKSKLCDIILKIKFISKGSRTILFYKKKV